MKKNRIQRVIIHNDTSDNLHSINEKINLFYFDFIKNRLKDVNLSTNEKILVIEKIIENLKKA